MSEITIPEEKIAELKAKYPGLTDDQIREVASSIQVRRPETLEEGGPEEPFTAPERESELYPRVLSKIGGGEMSTAEVFLFINREDKKFEREVLRQEAQLRREEMKLERDRLEFERKKLEAEKPKASAEDKPLENALEDLGKRFDQLQESLTQKKMEDAEKKVEMAEKELKEFKDKTEQEKLIDKKVQEQVVPLKDVQTRYEKTVEELSKRLENLPKEEKETFLTKVETTMKEKMGDVFSDWFMEKFSGEKKEEETPTKATGSIDWGKQATKWINRGIDIADEMVKKLPPPGTSPPKKEVFPILIPEGAPAPTPEQIETMRRLKELSEQENRLNQAATATPAPLQALAEAEKPYFPPSSKPQEEATTQENISSKAVENISAEKAPDVSEATATKPEEKPAEKTSVSKRSKEPTRKGPKQEK